MKTFVTLLIVAAIALAGWKAYDYCSNPDKKDSAQKADASADMPPSLLPGMPQSLEPTLQAAQRQGAKGLHDFLTQYSRMISDPRLASIELDYVVLVAQTDVSEARRVFAKVKQRTPPASPVYRVVKKLENTYE